MGAHYCKLRAHPFVIKMMSYSCSVLHSVARKYANLNAGTLYISKCTFEFSSVQKYVLVEMVVRILIGDKAAGHLQDINEEKEKKAMFFCL